MGDVEVDVVGAEAAQALFQLVGDRLRAEMAVHRLAVIVEEMVALGRVPDQPAFGGEHHLIAAAADRLADDFLGQALAIGGRSVNQADAFIDGSLDRRDGLSFVGAAPHPAADRPGA